MMDLICVIINIVVLVIHVRRGENPLNLSWR
jgi:hypothetical protein